MKGADDCRVMATIRSEGRVKKQFSDIYPQIIEIVRKLCIFIDNGVNRKRKGRQAF